MSKLIAIAHDKIVQGIALILTGRVMGWLTEKLPEVPNAFELWQELGKTVAIWLPIVFGFVKIWHYFKDRKLKRIKRRTDELK